MYNDYWLLQLIFALFILFFVIIPLVSVWFTRKKKSSQ